MAFFGGSMDFSDKYLTIINALKNASAAYKIKHDRDSLLSSIASEVSQTLAGIEHCDIVNYFLINISLAIDTSPNSITIFKNELITLNFVYIENDSDNHDYSYILSNDGDSALVSLDGDVPYSEYEVIKDKNQHKPSIRKANHKTHSIALSNRSKFIDLNLGRSAFFVEIKLIDKSYPSYKFDKASLLLISSIDESHWVSRTRIALAFATDASKYFCFDSGVIHHFFSDDLDISWESFLCYARSNNGYIPPHLIQKMQGSDSKNAKKVLNLIGAK